MSSEQEPKPLSVSEYVSRLNELFVEQVAWVEGEVCNVNLSQGKWLHFSIKDSEALINCFAVAFKIKTPIEDGMKVRIWGVPKIYPKFGKLSINVEIIEPSGEGALKRAFELLKQKLQSEGLFGIERKRKLTRFPERVGLVTSSEAAAYSDFLKVLTARRGGIDIKFISVAVQGREAPGEICAAIEQLNEQFPDLDALVLARGGGSLEDLHAFNDEAVVRTLARSRIPTITGVGHERDVTLVDFVADVRGSTPSNAAELLTPSRDEIISSLNSLCNNLQRAVSESLYENEKKIGISVSVLRNSISGSLDRMQLLAQKMSNVGRVYSIALQKKISQAESFSLAISNVYQTTLLRLNQNTLSAERILNSLHPQNILARGYSITKNSLGQIIKSAEQLVSGDEIETVLHRGTIKSIIDLPQETCPKPSILQNRTKSSKKLLPTSKQATLI